MKLFIGQIHNPNSGNRDDFDYLVVKTTEAEVITTIKIKYVKDIIDNGPTNEEELNSLKAPLKALLNVNSTQELVDWFEKHDGYFSFNIQQVTVID